MAGHGLCSDCGGHGTVTVADVEIPFEELSRRRQGAHALGRRFSRPVTAACPACDGYDRATAEAERQAEARA